MIRKKYEVPGMMEWHPVFKVGRSTLQISFTGGHLCGGACTAASFETSDPVVQAVIERSAAYRGGRIRIGMQEEIPDEYEEDTGKETDNAPDEESIFEYDDLEDVYEFLNRIKGVPLERLCGPASCYDEAKKLGVILKKKASQA